MTSHHRSSPRPTSMGRRRIVTNDDQGVHTGWRRLYTTYKRAGQSAKAKRRTRRRERVEAKRDLQREAVEMRTPSAEAAYDLSDARCERVVGGSPTTCLADDLREGDCCPRCQMVGWGKTSWPHDLVATPSGQRAAGDPS